MITSSYYLRLAKNTVRIPVFRAFYSTSIESKPQNTPSQLPIASKLLHKVFHESLLNQKSLDRVHRSLVGNLEYQNVKYGKRILEIEPTIRHLLVLLQKEHHEKSNIHLKSTLPTPYKIEKLLEPIVFHQILSLHYLLKGQKYDRDYVESQLNSQTQYMQLVLAKISKNTHERSQDNTQYFLQQLASALAQIYPEPTTASSSSHISVEPAITQHALVHVSQESSTPDYSPLTLSLQAFSAISLKFKDKYSIDKDLIPWILSVTSPNIIQSCSVLKNCTNIPAFVLSDVLLRTPMSKLELNLQFDMLQQFKKTIVTAYVDKPTHLKLVFNNLIFYTIHHAPEFLPKLISEIFEFLTNKNSGCHVPALGIDYINEVLWDVANISLIRNNLPDPTIKNIIKSQELLVNYLNSMGDSTMKINEKLNLKAHMGIVLGINSVSSEKALQLMSKAEKRFFAGSTTVKTKEMVAYNVTKTFLSSSPDELVENFNKYATGNSYSTTLWLSFIKRLNQMGLLTENRTMKILSELVKLKDKVIVSKDITSILIKPIKGLNSLDQFITTLEQIDPSMVSRHSSIILPKYLSMLYKNHGSKNLTERYYVWDENLNPNKRANKNNKQNRNEQDLGSYKGFTSVEAYARHIYHNCIKKKSARIIGTMLQGESLCAPETVFDIYNEELEFNQILPDKGCLLALIKASMKPSKTDTYLVWGELYATQIAIHEFATHTKHSLKDESSSIVPDDNLWQNYIRMLTKFSYVYELSEIIQWWERLAFRPKYNTLMLLLAGLPLEHSKRYISHVEKVRTDNNKMGLSSGGNSEWDWPTVDELEAYREKNKSERKEK